VSVTFPSRPMGSGRFYEYVRTASGDAKDLRKLKGAIVAEYKARLAEAGGSDPESDPSPGGVTERVTRSPRGAGGHHPAPPARLAVSRWRWTYIVSEALRQVISRDKRFKNGQEHVGPRSARTAGA
jgi:hypothetical protein